MFEKLRKEYKKFTYEKYDINETFGEIIITYYFNIDGKEKFNPTLKFSKSIIKNNNIDKDFFNYLVFHIGLIELISYWKCICPKEVEVSAGYIDHEQIEWFKKLYYYGLGEFFYTNKIDVSYDDFMHISCTSKEKYTPNINYHGTGNLIPVGGGKDSAVTLELLKGMDNTTFIINPKSAMLECSKIAGYDNPIIVNRTIDKNLIRLNKEGYLNGHTPFSSLVAFITYFISYLSNKKYIVLSNESSANESNVRGLKVNHQYSKSFEFENDFNLYTKKYFNIDIKYFSFLRPLYEIQIARLFSKYEKYHKAFKSCNVGSKSSEWHWCLNCPKCLFVYIILSPFLYKDKLINIFGTDLYENKDLLNTFIDLTGNSDNKPFECVGTYDEVNLALSLTIKKIDGELPYLLKYYKDNYKLVDYNLLNNYNLENNLDEEFDRILRDNYDK